MFTLKLRRERLLMLLVLQRQCLRPFQLFVHFIRNHSSVYHSEDYSDGQERLEDLSLPSGEHSVAHGCVANPSQSVTTTLQKLFQTFLVRPTTPPIENPVAQTLSVWIQRERPRDMHSFVLLQENVLHC